LHLVGILFPHIKTAILNNVKIYDTNYGAQDTALCRHKWNIQVGEQVLGLRNSGGKWSRSSILGGRWGGNLKSKIVCNVEVICTCKVNLIKKIRFQNIIFWGVGVGGECGRVIGV